MEKKTKIILAVGIIIVVSIMAMILIFLQEGTYIYTNEEIGFKLTLPKDWKLVNENKVAPTNFYGSVGGATFIYKFPNKNFNLELDITLNQWDFGKNMSTIVNETLQLYTNQSNLSAYYNLTIVSYNQRIINGNEAYEFNITGYQGSENMTKIKWIKVNNNEKYFDIKFYGIPSSIFDENENQIEQIINSFAIL